MSLAEASLCLHLSPNDPDALLLGLDEVALKKGMDSQAEKHVSFEIDIFLKVTDFFIQQLQKLQAKILPELAQRLDTKLINLYTFFDPSEKGEKTNLRHSKEINEFFRN